MLMFVVSVTLVGFTGVLLVCTIRSGVPKISPPPHRDSIPGLSIPYPVAIPTELSRPTEKERIELNRRPLLTDSKKVKQPHYRPGVAQRVPGS